MSTIYCGTLYRNVCLKKFIGVLSGKKAPDVAGTFFPATPHHLYLAYISAFISM